MGDAPSPPIHGIVLLPDAAQSGAFVELSAELDRLAPSSVNLGLATTLPHITVVHVEGSSERVGQLWERFSAEAPVGIDAETFSMYLRRTADGRIFVGASVHKSAALSRLQDTALGLAADIELIVHTPGGDRYWPHITLGLWTEAPAAALPVGAAPLTARFAARPVLALMSDVARGTVVNVLAEHPGASPG